MRDDKRITLMKAARDALSNSYSPYSNFKVGAAILTNNENIFSVCIWNIYHMDFQCVLKE